MRVALVVDDHALFRSGVADLLKNACGFDQVYEAESFDGGIQMLGELSQADLAIFDLSMPGMTSAIELRSVREVFPKTRVAVMTGSNRREDMLLALDAGVHGYVLKTLSPANIVEAFNYILTGQIYVPPDIARLEEQNSSFGSQLAKPSSSTMERDRLTSRQKAVLELISQGQSNKQIARELGLTENTVKVHANAIYRMLGVHDRKQLVNGAEPQIPRKSSADNIT